MNTDQKIGAGAYKADQADDVTVERRDFEAPSHLRLARNNGGNRDENRGGEFDYRQVAVAAGALGLGYLAFKGVSRMLGKGMKTAAVAAGHTGKLEPVPLARSATPEIKDNAAPRFAGENVSAAPFVAASGADDTGDLVVEVTEVEVAAVSVSEGADADRSARTPGHVPTDLMGDRSPGSNDRAIDAFRPDATAPVPDDMRDSLRPATGQAPSFAANRGTFGQGLSQTDGSK